MRKAKPFLGVVLLLVSVSGLFSVASASLGSDWPMFRHDLSHSGNTNSGGQTDSALLLWSFPTSASVLSSPAVADGFVIFGAKDSHIYCLNASTGKLIWSFPAGNEVNSSPAIYKGIAYVGSDDGWVYAINISSGQPVWIVRAGGLVRSSPAVAEGRVFVGSGLHDFFAFNASTGETLWTFSTKLRVHSSPAVVDGRVYFATDDFSLYALNASNGQKIWSQYTGSNMDSPSIVDGYIYIGSYDGYITALNVSDGSKVWRFQTQDTIASAAAVAYRRVYVGSEDGSVYSLNASTGEKLWQTETGYWVWSSPVVANGNVYVGSQDYHLYCLDAFTGAKKWAYETMCIIDSSPSIVNDTLYFGSFDYHLYALRLTKATAETTQAVEPILWSTVAFDVLFVVVWAVILFFVTHHLHIQQKNSQILATNIDLRSMKSRFSANLNLLAALLILAFAIVFLLSLGQGPLWAADEKTYSQVAYHMVKSGDYFLPWVNGEPAVWVGKPPLLMWLMSASYQVFGVNNFSTRMWVPLFGVLSLVAVFFLCKKLYNAKAGLLSVLVLGTFTTFYSFATHAMTDVPMIFFMLASIYYLLLSVDKTEGALKYAVLSGVFFGLALMTKQLEALLIPAVMIFYLLFTKQIRLIFSKRFTVFLGLAAAMFVPWVFYMIRISKDFFESYFVYANISRIANPLEGHNENYVFYFQYLLTNETFWAILLPFALGLCVYNVAAKRSKADTLIIGWILIVFALFTFAQTKLYWYILPAMPAFAIAIGNLVYQAAKRIQRSIDK